MSFVRKLFSRFVGGSSAGEFKIAEDASARLLQLLAGSARLYAFNFTAIPLKPEIQPMLGFLAAASDVFAHDVGGRLGGPGSINATLRVYQSLFEERHTEALMESTFELYREPILRAARSRSTTHSTGSSQYLTTSRFRSRPSRRRGCAASPRRGHH